MFTTITGSPAITAAPSPSHFCSCVNPTNWSAPLTPACAASCDQCNGGVSTPTCVLGNYVSVSATAPYTPLAPFGVATGTTLTATSTVRIR
jgi:hypothetical protein